MGFCFVLLTGALKYKMYSSSSEALVIHKKLCNKGKLTKHQTLALGSVNDFKKWQDLSQVQQFLKLPVLGTIGGEGHSTCMIKI